MTTEDGVWRDEERLPLAELRDAMGVYSGDGQLDDLAGNDAGAEEEFGDGVRGARPSPETGLTGPH